MSNEPTTDTLSPAEAKTLGNADWQGLILANVANEDTLRDLEARGFVVQRTGRRFGFFAVTWEGELALSAAK